MEAFERAADRADPPRRWLGLMVISSAQLMVIMSSTLISVAVPSIQAALGISDTNRAWIVTAYAMALGGFLVGGGSIADRIGPRRGLVIGLAGFALAAAVAGTAVSAWQYFLGVSIQGMFAAILIPSGVSMISSTFPVPHERSRALAVYGSVAASGAALGFFLGGLLTQYLTWRSCCLIHLPIAAAVLTGAGLLLPVGRPNTNVRVNVAASLMLTVGLAGVIVAVTQLRNATTSNPLVVIGLAVGAIGLAGFVAMQRWLPHPLIPAHILDRPSKQFALLAIALASLTMQTGFLFITFFEQGVLRYSPLRTGLSFLPVPVIIALINTQITARLLHRVRPQALMVPGLVCSALGAVGLSRLTPTSTYLTGILPVLIMVGAGLGFIGLSSLTAVLEGTPRDRAGVASALQTASRQIGGAVGLAVLNAVAVAAAAAAGAQTILGDIAPAGEAGGWAALLVLLLVLASWIRDRTNANTST